jgi:hypothetical protein
MFGANEMSICKQDLILQEELNCETSISVREAAFFLHLHLLLENFDLHEHLINP